MDMWRPKTRKLTCLGSEVKVGEALLQSSSTPRNSRSSSNFPGSSLISAVSYDSYTYPCRTNPINLRVFTRSWILPDRFETSLQAAPARLRLPVADLMFGRHFWGKEGRDC